MPEYGTAIPFPRTPFLPSGVALLLPEKARLLLPLAFKTGHILPSAMLQDDRSRCILLLCTFCPASRSFNSGPCTRRYSWLLWS